MLNWPVVLDWPTHARRLAAELTEAGALTESWRAVFESTPRHVFVPRYLRADGSAVDGSDPDHNQEWLTAVYSDTALTTQVRAEPDSGRMIPTSSSSRPAVMARMLAMLDPHPGHTVLDVGTGTGYNAALLAQRVGQNRVTSIDIDPDLVTTADRALRSAGLAPHLATADGRNGFADRAPFDRIIATGAVSSVPQSWVAQLAKDGVIVVDLRTPTSTSVIALHAAGDYMVEGYFRDMPGHFMWLRPDLTDPRRTPQESNFVFDRAGLRTSTASIDPTLIHDPGLGLMISACVPDLVQSLTYTDPPAIALRSADGAWARVGQRSGEVVQAGARDIWDEIETAARRWSHIGRPAPDQFRLTAHRRQPQRFWIGNEPLT